MTTSASAISSSRARRPTIAPPRGGRRRAGQERSGPLRRPSCRRRPPERPRVRCRRGCRAGEVGEHRRGLSEAHVEGEAPAESGGVEEPDPGERLGLVGAQAHRQIRRVGSPAMSTRPPARSDDVGCPAVAVDVDAATQPGSVEADAVAQDLRSGQLVGVFALGERSRRLFEVDPVDLDPAAHGTARAAGPGGRAAPPRRR